MSAPVDCFPVDEVLPELIDHLTTHSAVVLQAPPGAGKTTRVPPAILKSGLLGEGKLVMLEPRRMAARSCAVHMARSLNESLGDRIGYKVRHEERSSVHTTILVVTEGILTRRFISDPMLEGISCVIIDEFHERSVNVDLALAFIKEVQTVREDLKLVVMSATLDADRLSRYLGECPVVTAEGRLFPLDIEYTLTKDDRILEKRVASAIQSLTARQEDDGDLLVFLPGAPEIMRTLNYLKETGVGREREIVPLYGALPSKQQDKAMTTGNRRRIVLSTNIAETSLTIPNITIVVDTGLAKVIRWQPRLGLDRLETVSTSRKSAVQRAGRAGRVAPGRVFRMWTLSEHKGRVESDEPEIQRVDPAPVLLQVLHFHPGNPELFDFFDPIKPSLIRVGLQLLAQLGAIEKDKYVLTELGKQLASIPLHPRLGKIVLNASALGFGKRGALLAALLSEPDIILRSYRGQSQSPAMEVECDLTHRAELVEAFVERGGTAAVANQLGIDYSSVQNVLKIQKQILKLLPQEKHSQTLNQVSHNLLLAGFPDRVCIKKNHDDINGTMVGGTGVSLSPMCGVRKAPLFLALEAVAGKRGLHSRGQVVCASKITMNDLESVCPYLLIDETTAVFDRAKEMVLGVHQYRFDSLILRQVPTTEVTQQQVAETLCKAAVEHWEQVFKPFDDAVSLFHRLSFAANYFPDKGFPSSVEQSCKDLLFQECYQKRSFDELRKIDWFRLLMEGLTYEDRTLLDKEVPSHYVVPSGTSIRLDYQDALKPGKSPVLAVRLQEVFGMKETPRIVRQTIPLTLSLLAPNFRPVQVTQDLSSFWKTTYPQVRKELRARYAKHYWPEDPWTAVATNRTKKNMHKK